MNAGVMVVVAWLWGLSEWEMVEVGVEGVSKSLHMEDVQIGGFFLKDKFCVFFF